MCTVHWQDAEESGYVSKVDTVIKALQLERCADTIIGNGLIRGVSGGEKRRLTIGEMLVNSTHLICVVCTYECV